MDNYSLSKSSGEIAKKGSIKFLSTILVLLITFNFSWLLFLVKAHFTFNNIRSINRTLLNLESLLIFGNSTILVLFFAYVFCIRRLRSILSQKI